MGDVLTFERLDGIALLTLDRAERLNAIGSDTVALLHQALDTIEADESLRAVVVTGAGRAFSAGADIAELDTLRDGSEFGAFVNALTDVFARLAACATPSIAAVNGLALGGGFELALACDLRLAAPKARFGVPEVKLGLLPGAAGTQRLARLLPTAVAKYLLMTGEPLSVDAALGFGLINAVHDDVLAAALDLARTLAAGPPRALAAAKHLVDTGVESTLADGIVLERRTVSALFDTADRVEGLAAFVGKRSPVFTGR
ncbi:MAG: enoyl-CoA hydratase [Ilumatobacteraceae bacterium]|nr:enoyl-CoA hydratase [Ilumatobacteraceae bacterium]MCU1389781.1 enoyl-CoA hydratase [Ilumatobacteraceae bacterium]